MFERCLLSFADRFPWKPWPQLPRANKRSNRYTWYKWRNCLFQQLHRRTKYEETNFQPLIYPQKTHVYQSSTTDHFHVILFQHLLEKAFVAWSARYRPIFWGQLNASHVDSSSCNKTWSFTSPKGMYFRIDERNVWRTSTISYSSKQLYRQLSSIL